MPLDPTIDGLLTQVPLPASIADPVPVKTTSAGLKRDAVRTRRGLLDAARISLTEHGAQVSLDVIAKTAGVSKGGLLYHFRTKDELLLAIVRDMYDAFADEVKAQLESENENETTGRLTRAYVRATFREMRESDDFLEHTATLNLLHTVEYASQ